MESILLHACIMAVTCMLFELSALHVKVLQN